MLILKGRSRLLEEPTDFFPLVIEGKIKVDCQYKALW
jgi:hypothetical protein